MTSSADDRRARALELHLAGATYESIAQAVGYASKSSAHKAVQNALDDLGNFQGESAVTELARLDAMLTGIWPKARRGDLQAVDRVLKISERRSVLLAAQAAADEEEKPLGKLTALRSEVGKSA
jgi:transposase-like protein